ncbi:MAG: hypothetical protein JOY81_00310, partial [Alphaproteobacteria bacterium]|nr:hypothetical protein [Alphaproteobacteria bacterium]
RACKRRFWENSLFGGLSRLGNKHVRSGDVAQWKREFTLTLAHAFVSKFPFTLQSLGYERDHKWILDLYRPPGASEFVPALKRLLASGWEPLQALRQEPFRALRRYQA